MTTAIDKEEQKKVAACTGCGTLGYVIDQCTGNQKMCPYCNGAGRAMTAFERDRAPKIDILVLSIAANQFTVPLPTGKEVVRAVNAHDALVAAATFARNRLLQDDGDQESIQQLNAALARAEGTK